MFHVEHTPIQVLSTLYRRPFQQPEAIRVDQLQGQGRSQFRKAAHLLPIHTDLVIGFLAAGNPNGIGYPAALRDFTEDGAGLLRSEEHTSELQSRPHLVCRLLLEKKKNSSSTR